MRPPLLLLLIATLIATTATVPELPTSGENRKPSVRSISLTEKLGPLVVGKDGTTNRISNWQEMTESEKEVTLRRVTARNRRRLEALRANAKEDL